MGFTVCLCLWKEFCSASAVSWEFLCGVFLLEALTESDNTAQPASFSGGMPRADGLLGYSHGRIETWKKLGYSEEEPYMPSSS